MRFNAIVASLLAVISSALIAPSFAALPLPSNIEFELNRGENFTKNALGTQVTTKGVKEMRLYYDFATMGGAVGAISLQDFYDKKAANLPGKILITGCFIDVLTAPTSGGSATIALGTGQSTTDLKTATAIASYTGIVACVPVGTAATAIKITAAKTTFVVPKITIATAALTAGKLIVHVQYVQSE